MTDIEKILAVLSNFSQVRVDPSMVHRTQTGIKIDLSGLIAVFDWSVTYAGKAV